MASFITKITHCLAKSQDLKILEYLKLTKSMDWSQCMLSNIQKVAIGKMVSNQDSIYLMQQAQTHGLMKIINSNQW